MQDLFYGYTRYRNDDVFHMSIGCVVTIWQRSEFPCLWGSNFHKIFLHSQEPHISATFLDFQTDASAKFIWYFHCLVRVTAGGSCVPESACSQGLRSNSVDL